MDITPRGTPKASTRAATAGTETSTGKPGRSRIAPTVVDLGNVSLLSDIRSEPLAVILSLYITVTGELDMLALGGIEGIDQGLIAVVRIAKGRSADRSDRPKWVLPIGCAPSASAVVCIAADRGAA